MATLAITREGLELRDRHLRGPRCLPPRGGRARVGRRQPYGYDFDRHAYLVVFEAGSGSASSYRVTPPSLATVSGAVTDTQTAAC